MIKKQNTKFCRGAQALQDRKKKSMIYKVLTEEMYFKDRIHKISLNFQLFRFFCKRKFIIRIKTHF